MMRGALAALAAVMTYPVAAVVFMARMLWLDYRRGGETRVGIYIGLFRF
jgi:hypothetical protein